ncbi:type 1 glutamine amidotransferase [Pseudodonghicola flavimaris]|uniref:Type 1 glutamine amidotransferase n=1 Tax=Pseudodonghicola flavimaris TaxID=3050036 RepID=A0ABT7EYD5_9RHOB|nr:type 1 glutamine amidotransferase [Pseudodonghicola flavimaris]MDK3017355.1 type 1 glutamine amidotransferase [Pseudodonghicola flavimaris]
MTTLLILEGNMPATKAAGNVATSGFVTTLLGLAPDLHLRIASPYAGPVDPDLFAAVDGVVFTGSGEDWSPHAPEAAPQRRAMEAAFAAGRPVWGSCNGMQLAVVVLGGLVAASPNGVEVGMARDTRPTGAGRDHPMMAGRGSGFAAPCIHRDEVRRLPEGAEHIACNAHSPVQAMAYRRGGVDVWGTQYHPELRPADIATYVRTSGLHRGPAAQLGNLAEDLERAHHDPAAATRIGASSEELRLETRARELANWIAHVRARAGTAAGAVAPA